MKLKPSKTLLATLAISLLMIVPAIAQTKQPNLTGTWKMNAEKSKFEQGGPSSITIKFDHKDSSLSEALIVSTDGGDRTIETKYATDGKETSQQVIGDRQAQTSAKWEGQTLTIAWKADEGDFIRKISLSADGKTLTMIVTHPNGTDTVILEKQ